MGSWNHTCAVSNLHVFSGDEVMVLMLVENANKKSFCYGNALYDVCPVPFYGKYDDYGGVDECHGFGLNIVLESIRKQLYKFGQGPNEYYDIAIDKDSLDISTLFEADHSGRLGIENHRTHSEESRQQSELEKKRVDGGLTESQEYELDRLANKIKRIDTFRRVTHAVVRKDILDEILQEYYIEDYVGAGHGTYGHDNSYTRISYADILASLPNYISKHKANIESMGNAATLSATRYRYYNLFEYNDPCLAGRYMEYINSDSSGMFAIVSVREHVSDYAMNQDWDGLEQFTKEVLMVYWLNCFMSSVRKVWTKQSGLGSQNAEHLGYQVLSNAVLNALKKEDEKYNEECDDENELVIDNEDEPSEPNAEMASTYFTVDTVSQ